MRVDLQQPGSPADWLRHARSDLAIAGARKSRRVLYEHQCFHAQQAAEKAVKALLVVHGISIPRSHDIAFLLAQLPRDIGVPLELVDLPILTKYAVQLRYPGETIPVKTREHRTALRLATRAVEWVASVVCTPRSTLHSPPDLHSSLYHLLTRAALQSSLCHLRSPLSPLHALPPL